MRSAIRKHIGDFLAIVALFLLAVGIGGYILSQERLRFPLIQERPKSVYVVLPDAQAVQPGQGQTVRVAGVKVGDIGKVGLEDGRARVQLQIDPKYKRLIKRDATALLRTKTGLKDMFVEVDPGTGKTMEDGGEIRVQNTAPDIDPDEILSALDSDTRDYLKLLISGAGKGLKGRGADLRETFRRLGPLHRDLARVTRAIATRRRNLRTLVHNYGLLTTELGKKDMDLTRLVQTSNAVFGAFASEDQNVSRFVAKLPGALNQTKTTLGKVDTLAQRLGPALDSLRPAFRQLEPANKAVLPLAEEGTPIVRNQIRPFARVAQPFTRNFGQGARDLSRAAPDLSRSFLELNRFFNIGAYNPGGREGLSGDLAKDRARQEGYLYWLGWVATVTNSLFNTADSNGPYRRFTLGGLSCSILKLQSEPVIPVPILDQLGGIDAVIKKLGDAGACVR
jgi:phospholipid/cholesterol/gamma-HCH transport system substrate-binding protein